MKLKRKIIGLLGDDKGGGWHQSISLTMLTDLKCVLTTLLRS